MAVPAITIRTPPSVWSMCWRRRTRHSSASNFHAAIALVRAKEAALADLTGPLAPSVPPTELARHLAGLAAENQALLERAIAVQTRIVRIIARAAAPPTATIRYNGHGAHKASNRADALAVSTRA